MLTALHVSFISEYDYFSSFISIRCPCVLIIWICCMSQWFWRASGHCREQIASENRLETIKGCIVCIEQQAKMMLFKFIWPNVWFCFSQTTTNDKSSWTVCDVIVFRVSCFFSFIYSYRINNSEHNNQMKPFWEFIFHFLSVQLPFPLSRSLHLFTKNWKKKKEMKTNNRLACA